MSVEINQNQSKILIIYTGGTLGMLYNTALKTLVPTNFEEIIAKIPEINQLNIQICIHSFEKALDSSNITPHEWLKLVKIIKENYDLFDGFLVIHGTDTMSYTASALSFLIENNQKPILFTGAQLPIGIPRSDGRENILTSLELIAMKIDNKPIIREVCIYFNNKLMRANRTQKVESSHFDAFDSPNFPFIAEVGITIDFNLLKGLPIFENKVLFHEKLDASIFNLKLYPGINSIIFNSIENISELKGIIIETYGAGNAPTSFEFVDFIRRLIEKNVLVLNISQCIKGLVMQGRYDTSRILNNLGVISGKDMTTESAITKMMFVLGLTISNEERINLLKKSIRGEMTE